MRGSNLLKRSLTLTVCTVMVLVSMTSSSRTLFSENTATAANTVAGKQSEIDSRRQKLNELKEKQAELDKKIAETEGNIETEQENQNAINDQIQIVQETMAEVDESISLLNENVATLTEEIDRISEEAANLRKEIEQELADFKQRLRIMYIAGNDKYTEILLGAGDFFDMLMKMELVKRVAGHDAAILTDLIDKKERYEASQVSLEEKRTSIGEQLVTLEEQKKLMTEQRNKLNELFSKSSDTLAQLEKDKEAYSANQQEYDQNQQKFEAEIEKLLKEQEAIRKADEEKKRRELERQKELERQRQEQLKKQQQQQQQQSNVPTGQSKNGSPSFRWPVPGFYYISYGIGWRWGSYHKGIDIYSGNIRGASICAAADGKVILVKNYCTHDYGKHGTCCGDGYGRYCIIDHGNGWTTLYAHSENIIVTPGQYVKQGQKLGTVGSTGYSTGPHLHFEIRKDGSIVDPKQYLL